MHTPPRKHPLPAYRRALVSVLALPLALAPTTGCGVVGGSSGGDVTLRLVAADYGDSEETGTGRFWADVVHRFEAEYPGIHVEVDLQSWDDIDKHVAGLVAGRHAPDLVQTGGFADQVAADRLYPATDVLSIDVQADLLDSFSRAGQVLGSQYGIPFVASTRVFFYNKAVFAKAGISSPPATWEDLRRDAELIRGKVPGVLPYALPLGPEEAQAESMIWTTGGGGGLADDAGNYTIDSPQNRATFAWLRTNLVARHLTYADPGATNRKTAFNDFAAGRVAMLNGHPGLISKAVTGKIDYGTAAIPRRDASARPTTFGVADWIMAFKANGHRAEIKKFLGFLYRTQNQLAFDEQYNLLPVTQSARAEMTGSGRHDDLVEFLNALPLANFYPYADPSWDKVSGLVKQQIGSAAGPGGEGALAPLQAAASTEARRMRG